MNLLLRPLRSSLGSKYIMALTGLGLIGFVIVHMLGNLQIFLSRQALNDYAHHLEEIPTLLWIARIGLLAIFILHIAIGIRLWQLNRNARPERYVHEDTVQATWASRHMLLTGLVILVFVIYHLLHFTLGVTDSAHFKRNVTMVQYDHPEVKDPARQEYDTAAMVIDGFKQWPITFVYIIAQIILGLHLWHGGGSWLQSLGLNNKRWQPCVSGLGVALALIVVVGNCSIPLAIFVGQFVGWEPR